MGYHCTFFNSFTQIPADQWQMLADGESPFLHYDFLAALEHTGCVSADTGWQPQHLAVYDEQTLVAAMPGYLKTDSYGEYVFDHGWAQAYHQHGLAYYPKWVSCVPFTPVTGTRLLCHPEYDYSEVAATAAQGLQSLLGQSVSSLHVLFCTPDESAPWIAQDFLPRHSVQFQWHNYGYRQFDDFLQALTSRKRKALNKSRRQLVQAEVTIHQHTGAAITEDLIAFFVRCYQQTYLKRSGHTGYLSAAFFHQILQRFAQQALLVVAEQQGQRIACALLLFDDRGLYGRYWGSLRDVDGLHFECCYFQGIDFAISRGLQFFNPGTQGEHKILRGFEPIFCRSLHHLAEPAFHAAVNDFLQRETPAISAYFKQAADVLPYNESQKQQLKTFATSDVNYDILTMRKRNNDEI